MSHLGLQPPVGDRALAGASAPATRRAYPRFGLVEIDGEDRIARERQRILFSGDLGAPYAPLLPVPRSPWRADILVLESTYGDRRHDSRRDRRERLRALIDRALDDGGTVMIPAFSIGRTQELLYELEVLIHTARTPRWRELEVIVDSPLAARFTEVYRELKPWWDAEHHFRGGNLQIATEDLPQHDVREQNLPQKASPARPAPNAGQISPLPTHAHRLQPLGAWRARRALACRKPPGQRMHVFVNRVVPDTSQALRPALQRCAPSPCRRAAPEWDGWSSRPL